MVDEVRLNLQDEKKNSLIVNYIGIGLKEKKNDCPPCDQKITFVTPVAWSIHVRQ